MTVCKRILLFMTVVLMSVSSAMAEVTSTVIYQPEQGMLEVHCSKLSPGGEYGLVILQSSGDTVFSMSKEHLVLIDQLTADNAGSLHVAFLSGGLPECTVLLGGTFTDGKSPIILGRVESSENSMYVPELLTEISDEAFMGCTFRYVYLGEHVNRIGSGAFRNCLELQTIVIPSSVTYIAEDAFSGCSDVEIVCARDSAAHQFAVNHGISFRHP